MPVKQPQKKKIVRRTTMPRVTNNDLQASLIRMEESIKPLAEAASKVPGLQEAQIRAEGRVNEHDTQIKVLFKNDTDRTAKVEAVDRKVDTRNATQRAVVATLGAVSCLIMAVIGYFVSQQSSSLAAISDNTSKTAAAMINLDKRLTVAEYQIAHIQTQPASSAKDGDNK
jgi:hypothetical protein